jgi:geranylgeranylglycerol-phosphate geranylgeranyltransferase
MLKSIFQLARPINVLITMLSIFIGAFITGTMQPLFNVFVACLSGGLIAAASNTINDYFDIEIDKVNKPYRPLPSGWISKSSGLTVSIFEYLTGIILSFLISPQIVAIAISVSVLTFFYAAYLKRTVLWGNLAVSLCTAAAFIYGGMSVNRPKETLMPALFAFFYHFGREIIKDLQDVKGDRHYAVVTFPVRFGKGPSISLIWINFAVLIVLTIFPFWKGWYSAWYFLIVLFGVYPIILYSIISIIKNSSARHLGFVSNLLKADMLIGLLAIYVR